MEKIQGSELSYHDIAYTVNVKPPGKPCGKAHPKEIIRGVSGIFKPGVNAIMGPTGSGKTSLLDILAGRKDKTGLSGTILVDGKQQPKNFKCQTGYVVQDDMVMGTLTVRENLAFSANVRLSKSIPEEEKAERVDAIIRELGLTHCADTKIGNEFIRGVSGGERKRTNIGMELIISPAILYLDEPTTGLDSSTANAVMLLLHRLGRKGRTIIVSIHQPRYSIYRMFDRLMLLALGKTVYHGPSADTLDYFRSLGHQIEEHNNPADFFLDVINGDSTAVAKTEALYNEENHRNGSPNGFADIPMVEINDTKETSLANQLSVEYSNSTTGKEVTRELQAIADSQHASSLDTSTEEGISYSTSFLTQCKYLAARTSKNVIRNPQTSVMQIFITIFFALLVGLLYWQVDDSAESGLQNRLGAFFFIIMNQLFANMATVELFIKERNIFIHENAGGFYRVSSYYLSKVFCDIIPLRIIPSFLFSLVAYFMIGLEPDVGKFFIFALNTILTTLTGAGIGFFFSSSVAIFSIAQLCISLTYVVMLLFGGLLVNVDSIWIGIRWLQYFSLFRYSFNTFCINELKGLMFYTESPNGTRIEAGYLGEDFMDNAGIDYETSWDLWQNCVALASMIIIFLALTYVQLRRLKKHK